MPHLSFLQLVVVTIVLGFLLFVLKTKVTFIDGIAKEILYWGGIAILLSLWVVFILAAVGLSL